jgi:hypothetical protein
VISAGEDSELVLRDLVNESVFLTYSTRPATLEFMLERFRLPNSPERISVSFLLD